MTYLMDMTPEGEWLAIQYGPNDEDPALVGWEYRPDNQDLSDMADDFRIRTANAFVDGINRALRRQREASNPPRYHRYHSWDNV